MLFFVLFKIDHGGIRIDKWLCAARFWKRAVYGRNPLYLFYAWLDRLSRSNQHCSPRMRSASPTRCGSRWDRGPSNDPRTR